MSSKTLEQYLLAAWANGGHIDHALRAEQATSGKVTFYIRPLNGDGETRDFVVRGNALALNLTSDSDVPAELSNEAIDRAACLSHQATKVAEAIERLLSKAAGVEHARKLGTLMDALCDKALAELGGPIAEANSPSELTAADPDDLVEFVPQEHHVLHLNGVRAVLRDGKILVHRGNVPTIAARS